MPYSRGVVLDGLGFCYVSDSLAFYLVFCVSRVIKILNTLNINSAFLWQQSISHVMAVYKLQCLPASKPQVYSKYAASIQQVCCEYTSVKHVLEILPLISTPAIAYVHLQHFAFCLLLLVIPLYEVIMSSLSSLILLKTF